MRHGSIPSHSGINFYAGFGGSSPSHLTKQAYGIVPMASHYKANGQGRDTYIGFDNGGLYQPYQPDLAPKWGAFNEKKKNENDGSLCSIPTKCQ